MALTTFNGISSPRRSVTTRIATALHTSKTKAHFCGDPRRAPPDERYLAQLARRFAADTGLPLALAQKRVPQMAVSAPPPRNDGFQDRKPGPHEYAGVSGVARQFRQCVSKSARRVGGQRRAGTRRALLTRGAGELCSR